MICFAASLAVHLPRSAAIRMSGGDWLSIDAMRPLDDLPGRTLPAVADPFSAIVGAVGVSDRIRLPTAEAELGRLSVDSLLVRVPTTRDSILGGVSTVYRVVSLADDEALLAGIGRARLVGLEGVRPALRVRVEAVRDAFEDDDALSRARKLRGECGALWDTCCAATRRVTELKLGSKLDALGSDASAALLSIPLEQQVELQKAASAAPRETPSTPTTPIAGFDELAAAGANLEEATRAAAELLPEDELAVGCEEELFSLLALRWSTRRSSADDERVEAELAASTDCVARLLEVAERLRLRSASLQAEASLLSLGREDG